MAAIFYSPTFGRDVFRDGIQANTSVRVPFLNSLVGSSGFSIITDVSIQNSDTVQFFLTFDDLISYFYFGKGLGAITINGIMFTDCNGNVPGADVFYGQISRFRGVPVDISFGSAVFTGIISSFTTNSESEFQTTSFSIALTIIDHSLQSATFTPLC